MQSAWRGLWVSRLKTMLTLLSFVIGVSAVIVLVAIGQGNNDRTLKQLAAYGTHRMYVVPDVDEVTGRLGTLYETDVETVLGVPNVTLAMPFLQRDGVLRAGGHSRQMEVWSVNEYAQDLLNWRVARGMVLHEGRRTVDGGGGGAGQGGARAAVSGHSGRRCHWPVCAAQRTAVSRHWRKWPRRVRSAVSPRMTTWR